MDTSKDSFAQSLNTPSILLASDSQRLGPGTQWILKDQGFESCYAGDYSQLDRLLEEQDFDVVLLEVTGEHAAEAAVAAALRIKRARPEQFVGYVADSMLDAAGLAGDAVFPRGANKLPEALRRFFAEGGERA